MTFCPCNCVKIVLAMRETCNKISCKHVLRANDGGKLHMVFGLLTVYLIQAMVFGFLVDVYFIHVLAVMVGGKYHSAHYPGRGQLYLVM